MKKYELVKQEGLKDCGVSCLASIIKYYGGYIPLEKLREMTKTNRNGTTAYHLIEAAKELGFESHGVECELQNIDISKITLPAIAYTIFDNSYKHFVVIYKFDFKHKIVVIADPMNKIKKISFSEFNKVYKNVLIILFPIKKINNETPNKLTKKIIKQIILTNKRNYILILLYSFCLIILNILGLIFLKKIIDIKSGSNLFIIFVICLIIELNKIIFLFKRNKNMIRLNKKIDFNLTCEIFKKIILLPYNYYRNRTTGEIISRINDLEKLNNLLSNVVINIFVNTLIIIASGIFLYYINSILFLISFLTLILYIMIVIIYRNNLNNKMSNIKKGKDEINSYMIESITGFECIKGLNLEKLFIKNFQNKYRKYVGKVSLFNNTYNFEMILKEFINNISFTLTMFTGIILINQNILTIGELLIYNSFLSYFLEPIKNIFDMERDIKDSLIALNRLNELYYDENKKLCSKKITEIEIKKLNYTHNDINYLLKNIYLKIEKKDKIMLIGQSGGGKSTLLKIIKNYYKSSDMFSNGKYLEANKNVIYVSQNEFLFTDTLYNNITLNRKISDEKFLEVVKLCEIDEIIKDENLGYNMLIEENGFNISGGEKQRIVLARSLLTKFDVLLLDESLSEMDINLERKVLKKILNRFENKIIILVSHRQNNLDLFNKLFNLKDKQIELIKKEGIYA